MQVDDHRGRRRSGSTSIDGDVNFARSAATKRNDGADSSDCRRAAGEPEAR